MINSFKKRTKQSRFTETESRASNQDTAKLSTTEDGEFWKHVLSVELTLCRLYSRVRMAFWVFSLSVFDVSRTTSFLSSSRLSLALETCSHTDTRLKVDSGTDSPKNPNQPPSGASGAPGSQTPAVGPECLSSGSDSGDRHGPDCPDVGRGLQGGVAGPPVVFWWSLGPRWRWSGDFLPWSSLRRDFLCGKKTSQLKEEHKCKQKNENVSLMRVWLS